MLKTAKPTQKGTHPALELIFFQDGCELLFLGQELHALRLQLKGRNVYTSAYQGPWEDRHCLDYNPPPAGTSLKTQNSKKAHLVLQHKLDVTLQTQDQLL